MLVFVYGNSGGGIFGVVMSTSLKSKEGLPVEKTKTFVILCRSMLFCPGTGFFTCGRLS